MSRLSRSVKKVAPIVNPIWTAPVTAGKDILHGNLKAAAGDIIDPITGFGSKPGVPNPFSPPDLSFLAPTTSANDPLFQELLGKIGAPSSVDQVQSQVDSDQMKQLLDQIGQDTTSQVGSLKSDFQDRGLGAPGQISDIEAAGLGDLRANSVKARAGARLGYANSELARLKAKEDAVSGAYAGRYQSQDLRQQLMAKLMSDLYSGGAKNNIDTQQPGYLDNLLRNIKLSIPIGKGG